MPNHVTTVVNLVGPQDEITRFWSTVAGKESEFDFNRIVEQPPELEITSDGMIDYLQSEYTEKLPVKELVTKLLELDSETLENFFAGIRNLRKHGHASWYGWRCGKWGTKWNAYDIGIISSTSFSFDTAWAHPYPVFAKLSEMFPSVRFELRYADENIGSNMGHYAILGGQVMELTQFERGSEAALQFACEIKGRDYEDYVERLEQN